MNTLQKLAMEHIRKTLLKLDSWELYRAVEIKASKETLKQICENQDAIRKEAEKWFYSLEQSFINKE